MDTPREKAAHACLVISSSKKASKCSRVSRKIVHKRAAFAARHPQGLLAEQ